MRRMKFYAIAFCLLISLVGCAHGSLRPVGARPLDHTLLDQSGAPRSLVSFRGHPLVVYFYPRDGTPGCTREACAFRDAWDRYEQAGVAIVGVSTDDVDSHQRFAAEHDLTFPLLADVDGALAREFGVNQHFGMASRVTFVLDGAGVVRAVFREVDPGVHADEVLSEIARLGLVTPLAPPAP